MYYLSTRNSAVRVLSSQAIATGISEDGGLFIPEKIPELTLEEIGSLGKMSYRERAFLVLSKFLTDFSEDEIYYCVDGAYSSGSFDTENIMELVRLGEQSYMLELWHGPTCAFKDMALQILPYLLTSSVKKLGVDKKVVILVATSGDTGKAALEGFKDVPGTSIMVFYPAEGVSSMQKLQMTTQDGENVFVCAIEGNFDDAQTGVKKIFVDRSVGEILSENGMMFSSANSINWGRLVPQIIYYVSSYAELVKRGDISLGERINICVPTGNFGNILAAYYAKRMGVPVNKLICASNSNNVLTDFINTGVYDRNRQFYTTISPSMDILISSNLERLIYILSGMNDEYVKELYASLSKTGRFEVSDEIKSLLKAEFDCGFCSDRETMMAIRSVYEKHSYTMDTHTAVAQRVYEDYLKRTGDRTKTVIASTASPYKFSSSVLKALGKNVEGLDEFGLTCELESVCGMPVPKALSELRSKSVRFSGSIQKEDMEKAVLGFLGINK